MKEANERSIAMEYSAPIQTEVLTTVGDGQVLWELTAELPVSKVDVGSKSAKSRQMGQSSTLPKPCEPWSPIEPMSLAGCPKAVWCQGGQPARPTGGSSRPVERRGIGVDWRGQAWRMKGRRSRKRRGLPIPAAAVVSPLLRSSRASPSSSIASCRHVTTQQSETAECRCGVRVSGCDNCFALSVVLAFLGRRIIFAMAIPRRPRPYRPGRSRGRRGAGCSSPSTPRVPGRLRS